MSVLEKAKGHFAEVIRDNKRYKIHVAEWDADVYFKPLDALKADDMNTYLAAFEKRNMDGIIDIVILRALNSDGTKMFKRIERDALRREVSQTVLSDIVKKMSNEEEADIVDDETAGKS